MMDTQDGSRNDIDLSGGARSIGAWALTGTRVSVKTLASCAGFCPRQSSRWVGLFRLVGAVMTRTTKIGENVQ